MKKYGFVAIVVVAALFIAYATLGALINQGMSLKGAIMTLGALVLGVGVLVMLVRQKPETHRNPDA